jgi:isocitrate/isopropylmalate dehydrogenase
MRTEFGLFAGVRPVKSYPNLPATLADSRAKEIDIVILRESTEGLFAHRNSGVVEDDRIARDVLEITRPNCERLFDFAFDLAVRRKSEGGPGIVTCVDKANVFRSMAFFRQVFDERAQRYPEISAEYRYVDAMALDLVRQPWKYDVLVMENMFGDILSDLGAGIVGGVGLSAVRRNRDTARFVSTGPWFRARYCWDRRSQSDRDADIGCHDARVVRTAAPGQRLQTRGAKNSKCGVLRIQGGGNQAI